MFQLGSLVVLCGLLIGASESLLGNIGSAVNNLDVLNSPPVDVSQNLNLDVESLQQTTSWPSAKTGILEVMNTMDLGNLKDFSNYNGLKLKINKLRFLDIQAGLSSNGKDINLKLPLVLDISLALPIIGSTADVSISLDLINSVTIQTNTKTGLPEVTIKECSTNTDKISISLLGRRLPIVNRVLDGVSDLLTTTVSTLLQNVVCPIFQYIFSRLNASVIQGLLSNLIAGGLPVSL